MHPIIDKLRSFSIIPPIDQYPWLVSFSRQLPGKILLLVVFASGLIINGKTWWPEVTFILAAMSFFPRYRRFFLTMGTLYWLSSHTSLKWGVIEKISSNGVADLPFFKGIVVGSVLLFCAFYPLLAKGKLRGLGMRYPVRNLFVFYFILILLAYHLPLTETIRTFFWAFIIVLGSYLWYLCYTLLHVKSKESPPFYVQFGHYLPFWGGSNTPFPKGAAYLNKIEAKTDHDLAIVQLKAVKLIYWAFVLRLFNSLLSYFFYGTGRLGELLQIPFTLGLPTFANAFSRNLAGIPYPWFINWMSLMANFFINLTLLALWTHVVIAVCRMAGYNALRNTYKPLQARSIADFWNRYYFYFKELLVEIFFYPVFLKYFKKKKKLRLFFATMAAAGFGNVLYHFLKDIEYIVELGLWKAFLSFHVYVFYGFILGSAIGISQMVEKKKKAGKVHWFKSRLVKPGSVICFYCILSIFDKPDRNLSILDYFSFLGSLFHG